MKMVTKGVQPVILAAGRGSRMTQLIGSTTPKCLLPIAGFPLIYYSLQYLAKNGFTKGILVIIQERDDIRKIIEKIASHLKVAVDILCVHEDTEDFGTCESLRLAFKANKIKDDLLILSCDTIINVNLKEFLLFHLTREADCSCLFVKPLENPGAKLPGPKTKIKPEKDIVGVEPDTSRLVFLASEADFDEELTISGLTIKSVPNFKLYNSLTDAHFYLIKKEVLKLHLEKGAELYIKGEFLPYLIRTGFEESENEQSEKKKTSVYAYIQTQNEGIRVNTIQSFASANKMKDWIRKATMIDETVEPTPLSLIKGSSKTAIPKSAKVFASFLAEGVKVGESAKLANVICLEGADIGEGCVLENTLVGANVRVGEKSILKECLVGPDFYVPSAGRYQNETLTSMEDTLFDPDA